MATTNLGIYYPTEETNADFVAILSTLANSVDAAINNFTYDSGWIAVPQSEMLNDWEPYNASGSHVRYRKIGKIVYVDGIARYGTNADIFNLPVGFRPNGVYPNFGGTTVGSSPSAVRLRVTSNTGTVQAYAPNQAARDAGVGLSAISFVSD